MFSGRKGFRNKIVDFIDDVGNNFFSAAVDFSGRHSD